jgi:hypothetical protein
MSASHGELDYIALVNEHGSARKAAEAVGVSRSTFLIRHNVAVATGSSPSSSHQTENSALIAMLVQNQKLLAKLVSEKSKTPKAKAEKPAKPEKPLFGGTLAPPQSREGSVIEKVFVLCAAQNNTSAHQRFIQALEVYCIRNQAVLKIAPTTYNKNAWEQRASVITAGSDGLWYDPAIEPYLSSEPLRLAPNFVWCADFDRLPTAVEPLSGLLDYTGPASGAFPHIQMRMQSVATGNNEVTKFLYTTGCCTQSNFIQRAAGKKAEKNLQWSALVVEVTDDGRFFARQLECIDESGTFSDLNVEYSAEGCKQASVAAITWYDIHASKADNIILAASFDGPKSIIEILRPGEQFIEDLTDFEERNHHNIKSGHFLARMLYRGTDSVEGGMATAANFLRRVERTWCKTLVVESNHDQAFIRWLDQADGHHDPRNSEYWHHWNAEVLKNIRLGNDNWLAFEAAVREHGDFQNVVFLREDVPYKTSDAGVEGGEHGHRGNNGTRGGHKAYRGRGIKVNRGDEHSAGFYFKTATSGASTKKMGYNKGASSWSASLIVTYQNGGRQIITIDDATGEWCTPRVKPRVRVQARGIAA